MGDDYKDEFLPRLQKSIIYNTLHGRCVEKETEVISLVESAVSYAFQRTKTILKHMGEFTLHDGDHLFRVLNLMEKIVPEQTIKNFSSPELMILILSAFFHDIGMAPEEKQVLIWRKIWDNNPDITQIELLPFNEFKRFYFARPEQQEIIERFIAQEKYAQADTIKSYLITEFIRQTHAKRAREIIEKDWNGKILYHDADLTVEFAQLCCSHDEDAIALLDLEKNYLCAENTFACLPLIGVILRLADILDFDGKRTPAVLYSHLYVRNPVSLKEWNKHRAVEAWEINSDLIQFNAKCNHPAIEASIHQFCNLIDQELSICNNIISTLNEFNKSKGRDIAIKLPFKVNRDKITTKKDIQNKPLYLYKDTQFNLSKRQVVDLLMGTKLYGNSEVALRELLQNSIDACLLRQAQETKWGNSYNPEILVRYYNEHNDIILEIDDNGTGMDQDIIDKYYSKVGSSFYKSIDFYNIKSETNADFTPTSRFGIGILSCFMVADTLIVDTKRVYPHHKSSDALNITVEGQESIFWIKEGKRELPGTTTRLILRKTRNPWEKMTEDNFIKSVENVIPNPPFKINIQTNSHQKIRDENSFKDVTATSLRDYTWDDNENIRVFEISLNKKQEGIIGSALVAILESHGKPIEKIDLTSIDIKVEDESYTLEKKLWVSTNSITQESNSITVNDSGGISKDSSIRDLNKSQSRLSLHGIEVPSSLFPQSWVRKENQVNISFPFPLILVIDICGSRDLDLNSSRTEIIISEKWFDFEEMLAFMLCDGLSKSVSVEYWEALKQILIKSDNDNFKRSLNKVIKV
ncbi:MAG: ATP-binding protein [Ignavibacteria bacterium]|nr:ATP-binding protein [Ignavibacteria bacterium]